MGNLNFPHQLTSFIGREQELADILSRLRDPACRLLTLVGPGGIGKTRLAIQAAHALNSEPQQFHTIYYVPLQTLEPLQTMAEADTLSSAIADVLGVVKDAPVDRLAAALDGQPVLLLLDNFEELLAGAALLDELLHAAADFKVLVTSRELLNLEGEWIYPVDGMSLLSEACEPLQPALLETFDAPRLFLERARRVSPHFAPEKHVSEIIEICRLVDGMPLAIELAATWARSLSCAEILREIQRNFAFLATTQRNIPERHRSMRVVFDRSWRFLSPLEQTTLQRLAVFHGGFQREAAEFVAGATLPILTALVDKSLLRVVMQGRYQLHELVRQYAQEQLDQDPDAVGATQARHSRYYMNFLSQRREDLGSLRQSEAVAEIEAELENIRYAWQYAVNHTRIEDLGGACEALQSALDLQGRYREATDLLERATAAIEQATPGPERDLALAHVSAVLGWSCFRLARLTMAQSVLERSAQIYRAYAVCAQPGFGTDPEVGMAMLAEIRGEYDRAVAVIEAAIPRLEEQNDRQNLLCAYHILSSARRARGDYEEARRYAQVAYALTQETGNRRMQGYVLHNLGRIAVAQGHYDEAWQHFQACYELKSAINDPEGKGVALVQLAGIARLQGDLAQAEALYREGEAYYRQISDRGGLVLALQGLAGAALDSGDGRRAAQHLQEALSVAHASELTPMLLSLLVTAAALFWRLQQAARSRALLDLVRAHPSCDHTTHAQAGRLAEEMSASDAASDVAPAEAALHDLPGPDLGEAVQWVQRALVGPSATAAINPPVGAKSHAVEILVRLGQPQPLIEPLTERELEVLQLLAGGRSNKDIAAELIIAVGTVKSYTSHIYAKLGVENRTQAILRARELALIA